MKVTINGEAESFEKEAMTVTELLTLKAVQMPDMVTVELNGTILERETFDSTSISDGDTVEFLYFMGGGH